MKNIKLIVKEHLIKQYQIVETIEQITLVENESKRFDLTVEYFGKLIDEGYDNEKLENHIDEQFDWLRKLAGGKGDSINPTDSGNMDKLMSTGGKAGGNQIKQWMIRQFLGWAGLDKEGALANGIAFALSEMSIMDIVAVFRNKQGCYAHSQDVARGLTDGIIAALRAQTTPNSAIGNFIQNMMSQSLYENGMYKKLGTSICDIAYNGRKSSTNTTPTPDTTTANTTTTPSNNSSSTNNSSIPTDSEGNRLYKVDTSKETSPL
jgi:hypothetical protein